jgi:mRNA-degrading endonuclease RelE of RelBE toxin-antitoxin system
MIQTKIEYQEAPTFKKDLKKLSKRFRTLKEDIEVVKRNVIELYHLHHIDNQSTFPIPGYVTEDVMVCKVKKFACKSLKGKGNRSGIRLIYAFHADKMNVVLIEIYYKQDQVNEDRERIRKYLADQES